jgi:hypothetical protein
MSRLESDWSSSKIPHAEALLSVKEVAAWLGTVKKCLTVRDGSKTFGQFSGRKQERASTRLKTEGGVTTIFRQVGLHLGPDDRKAIGVEV